MRFDVTINGQRAEVEATITGKYYPATRFEPEEFPEVEIDKIFYGGRELPDHFWDLLGNLDNLASQVLDTPRYDDEDDV